MAIGEQLKRLVYNIDADASGVERGMDRADAAVEAKMDLIRRQKAIIKLQGDSSDLDAEMREARLKLKRFRAERADLPIGADTSAFDRNIALVEAEVAALRRQKAEIKVDLDAQGRAYQSARRLTAEMGNLNNKVEETEQLWERWGKRITGTRVNLGPFTTNLRTLMGILVVMGPIISGVVGAITALAGSLAEAATGALVIGAAGFAGLAASAAGAIFALKPLTATFKEVSTAQAALKTAQDKYGKSSDEAKNAQKQLNSVLEAAPPHIRQIETRWTALKDAFTRRTGGIRKDAVSVINDALRTAQGLLPAFARESTRTFHVASQGVHEWLEGLRSPEAERLLTQIMGNFRRSLPDLLHGIGQFATAFARITASASHFLPEFTKGFDKVATGFADSTENGHHLHRVIGDLVDQTHSWFRLIGATGRVLTTVLTGGARSGQGMIEDFTETLNEWNRSLSSRSGQRSMRTFFTESADTTEKFLGLLRRSLTVLFALARATEPFAQGFLEAANAAGDVVATIAKIAPLRDILVGIGAAMATIWAINKIQAWYTAANLMFQKIAVAAGLEAKTAAMGFSASFMRNLAIGLGGFAVFNIVSDALEQDWTKVGFEAGGAIAGGIVGSLVPGIGTLLGAGAGSLLGGLFSGLLDDSDKAERKIGAVKSSLRDLNRTMRDSRESGRQYARAQSNVDAAHDKTKRTADRVKEAEQHLQAARKRHGPNSNPALRAEIALTRATRAHTRAIEREKDAEKIEGAARKIRKDDLRTELGQLRANNRHLKDRVHQIANTTSKMEQNNRTGKRYNMLVNRGTKLVDAQAKNQRGINRLLGQAASEIGPKYAKQLQNMSLRALQFGHRVAREMHDASRAQELWGEAVADAGGTFKVTMRTQRAQLDATTANMSRNTDKSKNFLTDNLISPLKGVERQAPHTSSAVDRSMDKSRSSVSTNTSDINRDLTEQLRKFGANLQGGPGIKKQKGGDVQRKQRGGFTVPGSGDGDRYHTTLPPGAFVLNRRATAAAGFQGGGAVPVALESGERVFMPREVAQIGPALGALNAAIPRFAKGGVIEQALGPYSIPPIQYDPNHAGGNAHIHADFFTPAQAQTYGHKMQGMGWSISEYTPSHGNPFHFGPITTQHQSRGHYDGTAFDANTPENETRAQVQAVARLFGSGASIVGGRIKLPRFKSTRPATRGAVAGLNKVAAAAEKWGNRRISASTRGEVGVGSVSGNFQKVWKQVNPDLMKWIGLMGRIVSVESSGDPHAGGPGTSNPTHAGWYQYDASTWAGDRPRGAPGWPEGPYDPAIASAGAGNAIRSDGMAGVQQRWTNWDGVAPHLQGGGFVGEGRGRGIPGAQHLRLPPKPRQGRKKDFGTEPGSWYDWFQRAIDFYDQRGDVRNEAGNLRGARGDWYSGLSQVKNEEKQVQRIIHHDKRRLHRLLREQQHLPKRLRKSEPPKHFHFRERKKGEKHSEWAHAKGAHRRAWRQNRRDWERQVDDYKKRFKERREGIRSELPDLWQQLRVDLPTRYNEIREKLTGQREDIGLQQTAFGQERYQALTEFGGNFGALGFGVRAPGSRFGGRSTPSGAGMGLGAGPARAASGMGLGAGPRSTRSSASGSPQSVTHDNRRDITVIQNYKTVPEDPHTWSASMRHELGALA